MELKTQTTKEGTRALDLTLMESIQINSLVIAEMREASENCAKCLMNGEEDEAKSWAAKHQAFSRIKDKIKKIIL